MIVHLDGSNGFRTVARNFGIDFSLLRRWVASYQLRRSISPGSHARRYTEDFKRQVLSYIRLRAEETAGIRRPRRR